jgi:excisionase family DNA binding protein
VQRKTTQKEPERRSPESQAINDSQAETAGKDICTVAEAAKLNRCSADLIYAAIADGQLQAMRIGRGRKRGRFLIRKSAIAAWLHNREAQTAAEIRARR